MDATYVATAALFVLFTILSSVVVMREPESNVAKALIPDPKVPMSEASAARVRRRELYSLGAQFTLLAITSTLALVTQTPFTYLSYPLIASVVLGRAIALTWHDSYEALRAVRDGRPELTRIRPPRVFDRVPVVPWGFLAFLTIVSLLTYLPAVVNGREAFTTPAIILGMVGLGLMILAYRVARWLIKQPSDAADPREAAWVDAGRTETLTWLAASSFPVMLCLATMTPESGFGTIDLTINLASWYLLFFYFLRLARRYAAPALYSPPTKAKRKR